MSDVEGTWLETLCKNQIKADPVLNAPEMHTIQ